MKIRIFVATDVHGSEVTFRKFISGVNIYKVNVAMLVGDLTGKLIVPIVQQPDGTFMAHHMGHRYILKTREEIDALKERIRFVGYYPLELTSDEMEAYNTGKMDLKSKWKEIICNTLNDWLKLAEEYLKDTGVKLYIMPGNDDESYVDEILNSNEFAINPSYKIVNIDGEYEMISLPYSNITPWKCPRDVPEEKLSEIIEGMASQVKNMKNCIFNIHVPPYGTKLDQAFVLERERLKAGGGTMPVGSTAVLNAIKKFQPLLGIHGHIHESRGIEKIGRTICINPGSEYGEGILHAALIDIEEDKVKNATLTTG